MKEYILFLDESKPNSNFQNFTLGGVAIEKNNYEQIVKPFIKKLKIDIFENPDVILHEIEIRTKKGSFENISIDQQKNFFEKLNGLFLESDFIHVFAVSANIDEINKLYKLKDRNDIYYITLQLLMENFAHFLSSNNGVGTIFLESTDNVNNAKLQNLFYQLKATGTLFYKREMLQEHLSTINFCLKTDNVIGLQLADFIPNVIARLVLGKKQKNFSILEGITARLYDGQVQIPERFGCKVIK